MVSVKVAVMVLSPSIKIVVFDRLSVISPDQPANSQALSGVASKLMVVPLKYVPPVGEIVPLPTTLVARV